MFDFSPPTMLTARLSELERISGVNKAQVVPCQDYSNNTRVLYVCVRRKHMLFDANDDTKSFSHGSQKCPHCRMVAIHGSTLNELTYEKDGLDLLIKIASPTITGHASVRFKMKNALTEHHYVTFKCYSPHCTDTFLITRERMNDILHKMQAFELTHKHATQPTTTQSQIGHKCMTELKERDSKKTNNL